MNLRSVVGAGLVLAALTSSVALVSSSASASPAPLRPATQIIPMPPPGQATLIMYYLNGAHIDGMVGERVDGPCSAFQPWGITTIYYTTSFIDCSSN